MLACLTSHQHASVYQGRICSDNCTCCHTEIEVADPTCYLTQSQYTDTGPTSPSADPITPGAWQGSPWSAIFGVTGMTRPGKNPGASGVRQAPVHLAVLSAVSHLVPAICLDPEKAFYRTEVTQNWSTTDRDTAELRYMGNVEVKELVPRLYDGVVRLPLPV